MNIVDEYIDSITLFKTDNFWYYQEKPTKISMLKCIYFYILNKIFNNKFKDKKVLRYDTILLSYVDSDIFYDKSKIFINKVINEIDNNDDDILLDQLLLPHNAWRIDKYFEEAEAEVTLRTEKTEQIAEMYVTANGEKYRAVTEDKDMYASIDKDIDILEGQIRKAKTKKEKMMKDASLKTMEVVTDKVSEIKDEIVKTSYYEIKPITPEDAVLELQSKPTHNFLAFINVETGKVNVVHKLKDGKNYGLVEPEA